MVSFELGRLLATPGVFHPVEDANDDLWAYVGQVAARPAL
jgi:hypothetical protein